VQGVPGLHVIERADADHQDNHDQNNAGDDFLIKIQAHGSSIYGVDRITFSKIIGDTG
jgi:hypothetical protein